MGISLVLTLMQLVTMADEECQFSGIPINGLKPLMLPLFHQSIKGHSTLFEQLSTNLTKLTEFQLEYPSGRLKKSDDKSGQ
jgi:hypothetical protein